MKKLKLLKDWDFEGDVFEKGSVIALQNDHAQELVDEGIAEFKVTKAATSSEDDEPTSGTSGDGSKQFVVTEKQMQQMLASVTETAVKAATEAAEKVAKAASQRPNVQASVVKDYWTDDPNLGYKHPGEWYQDVYHAAVDQRPKRLDHVQKHLGEMRVKAIGSDEYASVEDTIGGFFIQPQFDDRFLTKGFEQEFIRANGAVVIPSNANLVKINAETDADRQASLYGGVQIYWHGERTQLTSAKGKFEQVELKPDFLTGLYYVTDHLLRNAPAMGAIIGRQFRDAFQRKETLGFISGSGVGEPLGIINAPATYAVARTTDSEINHEDVISMRARVWDYANAVWIAGMGTYEQIANMAKVHIIQEAGANVGGSGQLTWQQQLVGDRPMTLLGRPLIFTEHSPTLNTPGDLMCVSWPHYLIAESPDFVNDSSIHVRFDALETAFRFAKRLDGQPWWRSTLTVQNGYEMSPYVILTDD